MSSYLVKGKMCIYNNCAVGALAQLGERVLRKYEVAGSIPVRSTIDKKTAFCTHYWRKNAFFVSFFEKILKEKKNEILNIKQYLCTSIKNNSLKKSKEQRNMLPYNDDIDHRKEEEPVYLIEILFAELCNEEQYIIMEHAILDRKFKDIANELNKPLFTVTSIYRHGINKIKRRLS